MNHPRRDADAEAWRRGPGVSLGTWRYAHEGAIASRYDDFVAGTPLCSLDEKVLWRVFQPGVRNESASKDLKQTLDPPACVLDLGCGTGRSSVVLDGLGYDVLAIDLSLDMLRHVQARELQRVTTLRANLVQLDGIRDQSAAGAVCLFSTLGMIQGRINRLAFLTHVRRVVRPGGKFLLHVHNRYSGLTQAGGKRRLLASRFRSIHSKWLGKGQHEFGDAVYAYRGLPDMFLHQFSRREIVGDLKQAGWRVREWMPVSSDGAGLLQRKDWFAIPGGWLIVVE